jgi:hypothetical protein
VVNGFGLGLELAIPDFLRRSLRIEMFFPRARWIASTGAAALRGSRMITQYRCCEGDALRPATAQSRRGAAKSRREAAQ